MYKIPDGNSSMMASQRCIAEVQSFTHRFRTATTATGAGLCKTFGVWIHRIFEGNLCTEHSCYFGLGVTCSGDEVVVVFFF